MLPHSCCPRAYHVVSAFSAYPAHTTQKTRGQDSARGRAVAIDSRESGSIATTKIVTRAYDLPWEIGRERVQRARSSLCAASRLSSTRVPEESSSSSRSVFEGSSKSVRQGNVCIRGDDDNKTLIPSIQHSRRATACALAISFLPSYISECRAEDTPKTPLKNLENGLRVLVINGGQGDRPQDGAKVEINYIARLAAKQGWQFDNTYTNKDRFGEPIPFQFTIGDPGVIEGLSEAVRLMGVGGTIRVVIPTSLGYKDRTQAPIPREFSNRQRLYSTIFNPTRLANGEGETLGILIFDIELLAIR